MDIEGDLATLKSGVVLKLGSPSPLALKDALAQMEETHPPPKVPIVWIDSKEREEPNEADPDYQRQSLLHMAEALDRTLGVLISTGTSEHSRPEGFPGPEDEDFAELLEVIGLRPAAGRRGRYLQWVKYIAAADKADLADLSAALTRLSGTREEDVRAAEELFRGFQARTSDNGTSSRGRDRNRDRVRQPAPRSGS